MSGRHRTSTRSLTASQGASSVTNNTDDDEALPADTPTWGKSLYNLLNSSILALDAKLNDIQSEIRTAADTANEALHLAEANKSLIDVLASKIDNEMSSKLDNLTDAVQFLLSENRKRDNHILRNETYSRRDNLVFRGFRVARNDPESCEDKVRKIIREMGIPSANNIRFVRCHYLNEQKQIIARFQWFSDRERVWSNRFKLKDKSYYVAEDFPPAVVSQRRQLYPIYKAAKNSITYQKKVTMRGDRLILNGKNYTYDDADQVPQEVHPSRMAERSNETTLVFGGATSSHHMLSNFYNVKDKFVYEHRAYRSAEQAFQHKKALLAGDQNKQREIMFNPDPMVQKMLGQQVKGLDLAKWEAEKRDIMKDIVIAKFTQHAYLRNHLLSTQDKKLGEANGKDNYFAVGLPLTHPDVLDDSKWAPNSNNLGEILMEIRQELQT